MSVIENFLPARFQVLGELGRGGTSIVFRAHDIDNDREVAVKVLLKDTQEDRFRKEADRLASLAHPNVVAFHEVGRHEGRDFLVMEYLEYGDLSVYVRSLPVTEILQVFSQVCDGLAHLHDRGIVHRDIKPANILVTKDGKPKITDLGVARQMEANTRLTQAGTILGTYSYLAPEQILSSSVGPAADLYSLGICLFIALAGRKPFESDNEFNMLKAHLEEAPPPIREFLPDAPESLENLVNELLSKDPEDRPRSARAVADLLQQVVRELAERGEEEGPVWEERIEQLPDEQRSILLAITYLGDEATFEKICCASPYPEDKTDRCLDLLLQDKLVTSPTDDSFSLTFPEETLQTRLTPRLRKLFASRLDGMASTSSMEATPEESRATATLTAPPEPTETPEPPSVALPPAPVPEPAAPVPEPVEPASEPTPEEPPAQPKPAPAPAPVQVQVTNEADKPAPPAKKGGALRWLLVAMVMMVAGGALGMGGVWYYHHSGVLELTAQPKGASVSVDGLARGKTPIKVDRLKPGEHVVAVTLEGYAPKGKKVTLAFMESQQVHFTLQPLVGELRLQITPKDAFVTIGEQEYGEVSSEIELTAGQHLIHVKKEGYHEYSEELDIPDDKPLDVEIKLEPVTATLSATSDPAGATVRVDGKERGKTPCKVEKLAYGSHSVELRLKGHSLHEEQIQVKSDEALEVKGILKQLPGDLVISSEPSGAKLKLNGKVKGKTPQTLRELKAETYTITLSLDGYKVAQGKKTVVAGEQTKAHFKMIKKAKPKPPPPTSSPPPYTPPPRYTPPPPRYVPPPPRPPPPSSNPWIVD